ncbi:hypothetical protein [Bacillus sp. FJAT-22090]|uniref:hypothetical protein n=1 Tax=Bacillus sp. FJAT-22090 TaxID=1581038 RepID=UPI0011A05409|nr:hypothetical protein [Bacillus sp. FJAT-22090]
MEGIILVVISLIISTIFGKKKQEQKAPKPVKRAPQQKPFTDNPFKNLGELAKEFKQAQQEELKRRVPILKEEPVVPVIEEKVQREVSRDQGVPRSSGRLSVHQGKKRELTTSKSVMDSVLPDTKEELARAIILSEILAPPKSKR